MEEEDYVPDPSPPRKRSKLTYKPKVEKKKKLRRLEILDDDPDPPEPRVMIPVPDQPLSLEWVDHEFSLNDEMRAEDEFRVDDVMQLRIQSAHEMRCQVMLYSLIVYLTNLSNLLIVGTL